MNTRLCIWLMLLLLHERLFAQNRQYDFLRLDINGGLSHNQVNSVLKDEQGFVWFGTMSGLNRYDGYTLKVFRRNSHDTNSLSDDYISRIVQGPHHTIWVATRNGWNIYNPVTEKFSRNLQSFLQFIAIADADFTDIKKDSRGNFWFVSPAKGLYQYHPSAKHTTRFYHQADNSSALSSDSVTSIAETATGDFWIVYADGKMDKMDGRSNKVVFRTNIPYSKVAKQKLDYRLFADAQNDVWIYTNNSLQGLLYYNSSGGKFYRFSKEEGAVRLNSNIINGITQDDKGLIWVGTDHGGINLIDKKNFTVSYLLNNAADNKSISQNSIYSVYKDNTGIIWVGTFKKGVNYYHEDSIRFPLYKHSPTDPNSLPYDDANSFAEDAKGNLWIGTNGGGLLYFNRGPGTFSRYMHNPSDPGSLSSDVVVSLYIDKAQKLWIGTYYGGLNCFDGKRFIHYRHSDADPYSIAHDGVWRILEDSKGRLWIGTLMEGLDLYDRKNNRFFHFKPGGSNSVHSRYISALVEDNNKNIWIGTSDGIDVLENSTGAFQHYQHQEKDNLSLSNNNVISIVQDSRGWMWVGTRDGLNLFDADRKLFKLFTTENGLPDNMISTLAEDNHHNLWLSTPNGLSTISVAGTSPGSATFQFKNYDESDGLQGREFNENGVLKTRRGELIFGGSNGMNIFFPDHIKPSTTVPPLVLTGLQVFNKNVAIGEKYNKHVILPQAISLTKEIRLRYNENVFSIEFAALNFYNSEKIKYAFKLQGFNNDWLVTDSKNRKATYTNLDPGQYMFNVKVVNEDGTLSGNGLAVRILILPPFWRTPLAYTLYLLLAIALSLLARYNIIRRARLRFALEQERKEAHRLHELDMMKIKFFTNVSHEFRTPLSLIITPLEKMLPHAQPPSGKEQLQLIYRNARRLLNLVNQLLDFRKLETQELRMNARPGDIVQFIKELSYSFTDIAEHNRIAFTFTTAIPALWASFDHDKVERILFNLLSNAFKFTQEGGAITVAVHEIALENQSRVLQLKVKDTGIGIEKEKQEKIFERFFQSDIPASMLNQGSGIGLAITKEFVRLHGGTITIESEAGKGSCFTVLLPLIPVEENAFIPLAEPEKMIAKISDVPPEENAPDKTLSENGSAKKKTLLLIEDNEDFRFYLKDNLKEYYHIVEASNGKVGWQKALSVHPDLIVSDINMPHMNGIDLCRKLKGDSRTSFIPVILLTAFSGEEQQLSGLETGASDYITKPFNFEILLSKIKNLIAQQEGFKKTYQKQVAVSPGEPVIENADEKFVKQALKIVEANLSNPDFSVEDFSGELFLSRVAVYKKILALTGKTPIEFIRSIRLKRAAHLLKESRLTIAEVAYEVGFNNPKYFTKYFKAEFDILPSAYQSQHSTSEIKKEFPETY